MRNISIDDGPKVTIKISILCFGSLIINFSLILRLQKIKSKFFNFIPCKVGSGNFSWLECRATYTKRRIYS